MAAFVNEIYEYADFKPVPAPRPSLDKRRQQQLSETTIKGSSSTSSIAEEEYSATFDSPLPSQGPQTDNDNYMRMTFRSSVSERGSLVPDSELDSSRDSNWDSNRDSNRDSSIYSDPSVCDVNISSHSGSSASKSPPPPVPPRPRRSIDQGQFGHVSWNAACRDFDKSFNVLQDISSDLPVMQASSSAEPVYPFPVMATKGLQRANTMPVMRKPKMAPSLLPSQSEELSQTSPRPVRLATPACSKNRFGFLYKSGPQRKHLQKRWFTLDTNSFTYYADDPIVTASQPKPRSKPTGVIYLKEFTMICHSGSCPPLPIYTNNRFQRTFSVRSQEVTAGDGAAISEKLWYFEVVVKSQKGRHYQLAAVTEEEGRDWIKCLSYAIGPKVSYGVINALSVKCTGYFKAKQGTSGMWVTCWLVLGDRQLHLVMFLADTGDHLSSAKQETEVVHMYDMRKIQSISLATNGQVGSCPTASEPGGRPVAIHHNGEVTIYLQGQYWSQTELVCDALQKEWLMAPPHELSDQFLTADNIPVAIEKCINFISTYGGLTTKGIYRIPGTMSSVKPLFDILKANDRRVWELHLRPEDGFTVHDIVSAFKMYLQSFDECLFTDALLWNFLDSHKMEDRDERLGNLKRLLVELPVINYSTLKRIIGHLSSIVDNSFSNEMVILNLCTVISTTLFFCSITQNQEVASNLTTAAIAIVSDLVTNYVTLFDITDKELETEKIIQDKLKDIMEAKRAPKPAGDIIISVYVKQRCGHCLTLKVSPGTSAWDVVKNVCKLAKLGDDPLNYSLYEIVAAGQLERLLHFSDLVLNVVLSWSVNWPPEDSANCYLVVKSNKELFTKLMPYLQLPRVSGGLNASLSRMSSLPFSLFSELRYSDLKGGKTFKKIVGEVIGSRLVAYNNFQASKQLGDWDIKSILWYIGHEKKRQPPTTHCFTFVDKDVKIARTKENGHLVSRVLCCSDEEELLQWIAGLIITEHPKGLYPAVVADST
ncbi:Arf-GAP with Rho-GAP domain, ANK repeat and PH domain-containing protein 1 [Halotydeus destructor]|nr:Arf-GAP with Rho-GAP domain, ANK repeat and PH domain-containing protein 1 [Halotydeus destructor]